MMEFHVITPQEHGLVMQTEEGRVVEVWPAPASSLPVDALAQPAPDK